MLTIVIAARGGSKGLPGKNLALVGGIPLVGRAARSSRLALRRIGKGGRVVCTTDDADIAAAAREWGAEMPFLRAAELSTDTAASIDVLLDVVERLALAPEETLVLVQPTSPLVEADDIVEAVRLHRATGDPVVGVTNEAHPSAWTFSLAADGRLVPATPTAPVTRRQDEPPRVRVCGAVYVAEVGCLRDSRSFLSERTRGLVIPQERALDVDTACDLMLARGVLAMREPSAILVGDACLGPAHPPLVIAEAGVNHNGSVDLALRLVDAAREAGAGAVKFQTFRSESVVSPVAPQARYQHVNTGVTESQLEMVRRLELSTAETKRVHEYCRQTGVVFLSSPFDEESAELLVSLGVPGLKIGSGEITNHPYLARLASFRIPLLLSTGMSTLSEVGEALDVIEANGAPPVVLLHCVSSYPAPALDANLAAMRTLREAFARPVGWSDHTPGVAVSVAAVALEACVIEKHFTLDRTLPGPDHRASLEPSELAELVRAVDDAWVARGDGLKRCRPIEEDARRVARRSLFASRDLPAGTRLSAEDLVALRPGTGISPARIGSVDGRRVRRDVMTGEMLAEEDLE